MRVLRARRNRSTAWHRRTPLPQITELDPSPVIARRDGAFASDARIHLQPAQPTDAYPR
jgi:hypothetical protein